MINLKEIKAAARAATPGPWKADGWDDDDRWAELCDGEGDSMLLRDPKGYEHSITLDPKDAHHIATMDPQTTLELVDEFEAERAKNVKYREALEAVREWADRASAFARDETDDCPDVLELRALLDGKGDK